MNNTVKVFRALRPVLALCILQSLLCVSVCRADNFGDVWVSADAIYTGNTYHGYAETRLTLENHSTVATHAVTLNFPADSYGGYGNNIGRLSRSVTLAPQSHQVVTLLQPPLPINGRGSIGVEVEGRSVGDVRAPNANNHCGRYSYSGGRPPTIFISRGVDFDAVCRIFNAGRGPFSAAMAVGPPDATLTGARDPNDWIPDFRAYPGATWLELDYATPQLANEITIYSSDQLPADGTVQLTTDSGAIALHLSMSSGTSSASGPGRVTQYLFSGTASPVKTVRLDFGKASPFEIGIDAVQISGPSGSQWAADARASSNLSPSSASISTGDSIEGLRSEVPASEFSADWLAYTPFDFVVLSHRDFAALSPEAAAALWSYAQAGGNLLVFGSDGLPQAWQAPQKPLNDGTEYSPALGTLFVMKSEDASSVDPDSVQKLRGALNGEANYWQSLPSDLTAANSTLPLVDDLKLPIRGLVFLMLVFVILIGPVNLIVLNRRKRRTWMLWTIPAISLATTLLVFVYILLREGITPTVRIAGLTVLDQASHHAATIGGEGYYCPLTPSGGLHFDLDTEATPLLSVEDRSGNAREVEWSGSQNFSSGWVSARVPAFFHLRKSETRRERVQVENKNGGLQIVNGLGASIKSVWFADAHMNMYQARDVGAGQTSVLTALSLPPAVDSARGPERLWRDISFTGHADGLDQNAVNYLTPNTYIAVLDGNPFLENALGSART